MRPLFLRRGFGFEMPAAVGTRSAGPRGPEVPVSAFAQRTSLWEGWVAGRGAGLLCRQAILLKSLFVFGLCSAYIKSDFLTFPWPSYSGMYRMANRDHEENCIKNLSLIKCKNYTYEHNLLFVYFVLSFHYRILLHCFSICCEDTNMISCYYYSTLSCLLNGLILNFICCLL